MTRRARTLFLAVLAGVLAPFVLFEPAGVPGPETKPVTVTVPVEQGAHPVTCAPRTVLPELHAERLQSMPAAASAAAESARVQPVLVACGLVQAALPGGAPLRPFHPSRGPPELS